MRDDPTPAKPGQQRYAGIRAPRTGGSVRAEGPIFSASDFGTLTVVEKNIVVTAGVTDGYYGTTGGTSLGKKQSSAPWVGSIFVRWLVCSVGWFGIRFETEIKVA